MAAKTDPLGGWTLATAWSAALLIGTLSALPAEAANLIFVARAGETTPVGALDVQPGDSITLDLHMDFQDTTVGGGVSLLLDAALFRLDGVSFDAQLGDDADLRCAPATSGSPYVACPGHADGVGFGSLAGLAGPRVVATLQLTALADGTATPGVSQALPFSDARGRALEVVYLPEPGGPMLIAAGIAQLLLLRRWRRPAPARGAVSGPRDAERAPARSGRVPGARPWRARGPGRRAATARCR